MKKNKGKTSGTSNDAPGGVEIAPEALANLADRLKLDLASQGQVKAKNTPVSNAKANGKKERKEKQGSKKDHKAEVKANGSALPQHPIAAKEKEQKSEKKSKNTSNSEKKSNAVSTLNGKERSAKEAKNKTSKADSKQSGHTAKETAPTKAETNTKAAPTKKDKKHLKTGASKTQESTANPLLDEILALGGTKEDLDLVEDVDSEEDLTEEVEPPKKSKSNEKTLKQELQAQLKSLGLDGKFPDASSDDEEEAAESNWTDEEEDVEDEDEDEEDASDSPTPPPPKASQKKATQSANVGPTQPKTIDRPVQLSTTAKPEAKPLGLARNSKLKLEPHSLWYEIERPPINPNATAPNAEIVSHLHARGKVLLQTESDNYMTSNHITSSDRQFLSTIMTSGTQSDRLSALTLAISASPLHCQKQLDALLGMAKKKSRNEAVQAVAALKDLLTGNLLPDRKLVYFGKQPGLESSAKDEALILWTFEDWLKGWYFQVLQVIEGLYMDPLPFVRNHMISYISDLLRDKPEQEQLLLRLLVNKLGDGAKKIAAKTSYFLLQLESTHPQMKSIVLHEMENLLFQPNTSIHAQYYTIITMNQTILTARDTAVANRLVEVYFMLFVKLLRNGVKETEQPKLEPKKKKFKRGKKPFSVNWDELNQQQEEVNSKILSAVLTGVNRAFPFSKVESNVFEKHMDILFMITHDANFNTAIQALMLIYQVVAAKQIALDRYYRTLYESLMDRRLVTSSKQALYLNLLFKSLKSDTNIARVKAFIKRIVQITSMHTPGFICGVLFLLAELTTSRPELKSLWAASTVVSEYNSRKRDPLYANADSSSLWELSPLLQHYHPTVQLYAENLLNAQPNTAKPDLALHTVKHFLDRFVYRNPKTKAMTRGASIMQPLPGTDTSLILGIRGNAKTERAVNSEEWWRQQVDRIRPDEVFFHKFFVLKEESEVKALGRKRKRGGEDGDLDEDEIWEALVKSSKEEGGMGDVNVDDDDSVDWSDEDELDEDALEEMNEGMSDLDEMDEDMSDMEGDMDDEEISGEEGDVNDFFDDEAEEVGSDEEDDEEVEDQEDEEASLDESVDGDSDEEGSEGVGGRFEFGDSASDIMDSDEDIEVPVQQATADRSKKRKLKNLPTFASADDYADMLDD